MKVQGKVYSCYTNKMVNGCCCQKAKAMEKLKNAKK